MKLQILTKPDKGNTTMSNKIDDDVMLETSYVIFIFSIYHQFRNYPEAGFRLHGL